MRQRQPSHPFGTESSADAAADSYVTTTGFFDITEYYAHDFSATQSDILRDTKLTIEPDHTSSTDVTYTV